MPKSSVASLARSSRRQPILKAALYAPDFRQSLAEAATEIRGVARPTATEATVEGAFERVLYARLREIGVLFHPEKESGVSLKRHLTRGRMDSRLGALVLEYKRPSLLKSPVQINKALDQLKGYLTALSESSDAPFVGILTNGLVGVEVWAANGSIISQSAVERVTGSFLLRLTQHFISLALTALTPANLIRDFCGSSSDGVLFQTARVLNTILSDSQPKTLMLFSEWEEMFRLAHDDQSQQKRIEERRAALAELFDIELSDAAIEYQALFALHTAYAILLKFMAYRTVSDIYLGEAGEDYRSLASASNTSLRVFCDGLEDGEIFRRLNIINLLEGDFFSWYADKRQWTPALADSMRSILEILARYEEAGHMFDSNEAPDLFRELYQAAVPQSVRSSFGEFYTPYWLAEHVLESAAPKKNWRAIDPCCGSGTFVVAAIAKLRNECRERGLNDRDTLKEILSRVVAIDLNPLGVLTTRINYFIHISNLFATAGGTLVIPVYLGDAAAIPTRVMLEGVECIRYELRTLKKPITTILPLSLAQDTATFMRLMLDYEQQIQAQNHDAARRILLGGIPKAERKFLVRKAINEMTEDLIELERNGWNGIWARILSNFLSTACLGRFSVVIGNPPWIDWKNLPEGYRNRVKEMCVERGLFSGAGRTGGINLNICALISYVAMTNWLDRKGRLAFLMPRELANQASYEGWRRLGGRWTFFEFHDWSKAGHPFDPVKEDFMTFVIGSADGEAQSVPVTKYVKRKGVKEKSTEWKTVSHALEQLEVSHEVAGQIIPQSTAYTFARDQEELNEFAMIAGECEYIGREGIEFYPQELFLFTFSGMGPQPGMVWLHNIQVTKSKYRIPRRRILLETTYLHPLVKGPEIGRYQHDYSGLIVAFPYDAEDPIRPIPIEELQENSPHLLNYFVRNREVIDQQTKFSDKIRGLDPGEFYGLARTGPYSFASTYVAFRDNTKWRATVLTDAEMPWGERTRFVFQNHAVSMCERRGEDDFIGEDEAHFVCAILNTPIVERFIYATSDTRSYKVRPPVFVPPYDPTDKRHVRLSEISREAHADLEEIDVLRSESEALYLNICRNRIRRARRKALVALKLPF
jgi:methylase of polypeptide subunit release factors